MHPHDFIVRRRQIVAEGRMLALALPQHLLVREGQVLQPFKAQRRLNAAPGPAMQRRAGGDVLALLLPAGLAMGSEDIEVGEIGPLDQHGDPKNDFDVTFTLKRNQSRVNLPAMPVRQKSRPAPADAPAARRADDASFTVALLLAAEAPALRKSERTRLRLLAAIAARFASGDEPASLRVSDIVREAGLAHGTFYRYFADRQEALEALIADFARFQHERLAAIRDGAPGSPARVRAATLEYVRLFRSNAGLMRCLMGLGP